jgi:hypothetical protein
MNKLVPCLCLVPVLLLSCVRKPVNCGDPAQTTLAIALVDQNDSLLIGKKYAPDSIYLYLNEDLVPIEIYQGFILVSYSQPKALLNVNLFLYLSATDTDTLRMGVSTVNHDDCPTYWVFNGLDYNGTARSPEPQNLHEFLIIKN